MAKFKLLFRYNSQHLGGDEIALIGLWLSGDATQCIVEIASKESPADYLCSDQNKFWPVGELFESRAVFLAKTQSSKLSHFS
jgi:hypothetical protein